MSYTPDLVEEINLLTLYNILSMQEGIKVHKAAGDAAMAAAKRLHAKGLITQADGGYLTNLGVEATRHAQALLTILASK
jgi:uncharacterized protein (TIGR02647 family)